jgi:hypothetical protein
MAVAFAAKLRMAATALGCPARKALCARFRAVNPATQCDLDRLNKWVQGRSLPRALSVYDDLARVIGSARPGRWVAECSAAEFAAELVACTGADPADLAEPQEAPGRGGGRAPGLFGGVATLAGAYAGYSHAWSPHFRGRLLRGTLRLAAGRGGGLAATYSESLVGREVRMSAAVELVGRTLHLLLREPGSDLPLFVSLILPGPPASVMCGVMSGAAFVASEPLPSTTRIAFIRVPDTPALERTNRYFAAEPGAIAGDLAGLGLAVPAAERLDALLRGFLGPGPEQLSAADQAGFAAILDPVHFAGVA